MNLFKKKKKRPQINSSPDDDEIPINSDYHQMYATTTNHSRSPSVAYREGTKEAIGRVLETIEEQAEKRIKDGFSELNFTLGVLNCFFIEFVFTVYPQHLWVVYLIEGLYLFPYKVNFLLNTKPLNSIYFLLDYCWIMNLSGIFLSFLLLFAGKIPIPNEVRYQLFLGVYGTAVGPLLGATMTLPFVSLIFHNRDFMTSVFIHFYPPLLLYILRWMPEKVNEAWPEAFDLNDDVQFWPNGSFTGNVVGNTMVIYMLWFVPYTLWQLFIGLDLPRQSRKKILSDGSPAPTVYDTVFHANMRAGLCVTMGNMLWKRPKEVSLEQCRTNDFELRDLIVYMGSHLVNAMASIIVFAYPCYLSKYVHAALLWILIALCTYRGGKRYTYYSTKMYARIIRKHFADEINPSPLLPLTSKDVPRSEVSPLHDVSKENGYQSVEETLVA